MAPETPSIQTPRAPTAAQVVALIRQRVRTGGLPVGEVLPAERTLAQNMGVARGTLRAALRQLEGEGVIQQQGIRRRIHRVPAAEPGLLTDAVGIITVQRNEVASHQSPGWETFVEVGAMQQARQSNLNALMLNVQSLRSDQAVRELTDRPLRGVAVVSAAYRQVGVAELLDRLDAAGLRVVTEGDPEGGEGHDRVVSDHAAGAAQVTRHLLGLGRRRIVYLLPASPANQYWVRHRLAGYRAAMAEAGLEPLPPSMQGRITDSNGDPNLFEVGVMQMLGYLVDYQRQHGGFDALMCASDGQVPQTIAALRKLGLTPQRDVLVTGYDNFWEDMDDRAWEDTPPLVTVDKRNIEIGHRLVNLLLTDAGPAAPRIERITPRLVTLAQPLVN